MEQVGFGGWRAGIIGLHYRTGDANSGAGTCGGSTGSNP